jgi:multicomponent Na+:H+ antiporter subunit E
MLATLLLAVPFAVIWMIVTSSISLDSCVVGGLLGIAILMLMRTERQTVKWRRLPQQLWAFAIYSVTLTRDIILCSVDVTRRVIQRDMPITPGILAVSTQDFEESDVIAAFSAHGITITPGELVVDFDGAHTMFVHCLDIEASAKSASSAQTKRLQLLRTILGVVATS